MPENSTCHFLRLLFANTKRKAGKAGQPGFARCRPMPYHAIPCHAMPYNAIPCHTMPRRAVPACPGPAAAARPRSVHGPDRRAAAARAALAAAAAEGKGPGKAVPGHC